MFKIGITGSIGTGKTTANLFVLFNIPVFDADREIKELLNREEIKKKLERIWPHIIENNEINKGKLKLLYFQTKKKNKIRKFTPFFRNRKKFVIYMLIKY